MEIGLVDTLQEELPPVKIRPLMDGNLFFKKIVKSLKVKIRPLMDGNTNEVRTAINAMLKSDH